MRLQAILTYGQDQLDLSIECYTRQFQINQITIMPLARLGSFSVITSILYLEFSSSYPGFESTTDYSRHQSPNNFWMISLNRDKALPHHDLSVAVRIRARLPTSFEVPATTAQSIRLLMRRTWTFASGPSEVHTELGRWLRWRQRATQWMPKLFCSLARWNFWRFEVV